MSDSVNDLVRRIKQRLGSEIESLEHCVEQEVETRAINADVAVDDASSSSEGDQEWCGDEDWGDSEEEEVAVRGEVAKIVPEKQIGPPKSSNRIERFKRDLGLLDLIAQKKKLGSKLPANVEVTVWKDPRKRALKRKRKETKEEEIKLMDLEKARFEVEKFTIANLTHGAKESAEQALAIRLGAKMPKNVAVNYKQLMVERASAKKAARSQQELDRAAGNLVKTSARRSRTGAKLSRQKPSTASDKSRGRKRRQKSSGADAGSAQIGVTRGGVTKLSSKDVAKIKSSVWAK